MLGRWKWTAENIAEQVTSHLVRITIRCWYDAFEAQSQQSRPLLVVELQIIHCFGHSASLKIAQYNTEWPVYLYYAIGFNFSPNLWRKSG